MNVRKGVLWGSAVVAVAAAAGGIAYVLRDDDEGEEDPGTRTPQRGKATDPGKKSSQPKKPAPLPSSTSIGADGVYRLTAHDLRDVTCAVRQAGSARTVVQTLDNVAAAVAKSEAKTVDLRNTGVVQDVMSRDEFVAEVRSYARDLEGMSALLWIPVRTEIHKRLAGLPACDAPMASWEAAATGASTKSRLMSVAPSPAWGAFEPRNRRTT